MLDHVTIRCSALNLVYSDGNGNLTFQPYDEAPASGWALAPGTEEELELIGWTTDPVVPGPQA